MGRLGKAAAFDDAGEEPHAFESVHGLLFVFPE